MAAALSAAGGQSTQLGHWVCCDMASRRGTQRALDIVDAQRPRHCLGFCPRLFKFSSAAAEDLGGLAVRQPWFLLTCSRTLRRALSSRATVDNLMNTASSEEHHREVDHDLKLDEDTF